MAGGGEGQYPTVGVGMALPPTAAFHIRYIPEGFTAQIETLGDYVLKLGHRTLLPKEYRRAVRILQKEKAQERTGCVA